MSLATGIFLMVGAILLNVVVVLVTRRLDRGPVAPNYIPDLGVDADSLNAVPELLVKYGVKADIRFAPVNNMPDEVLAFFEDYEGLKVDYVINLCRSYLTTPYIENADFIRIGLMNCEDNLLVRKSAEDANIYIVGAEDSDPKKPELFATSFANLLAIVWHEKKELDAELKKESDDK